MSGDRLQTNVARLLVMVSILGAVVSWRASEWSETASSYDQQVAQDRIVAEQAHAQSRSKAAQDQRELAPAQSRYREVALLQQDAARAERAGDAEMAAELRVEARRAELAGNTLTRFLQSGVGFERARDGSLTYDVTRAVAINDTVDQELDGLQPEETRRLGDEAHDRSVNLVFAATTLVAALFFLTLSQLGGGMRRVFAGVGLAIAVMGTVLFAIA
jgi:hypothetical protein